MSSRLYGAGTVNTIKHLAHMYVMLSRATKMEDLLLLRPPPKDFFERGPPPSIVKALQQFENKRVASEAAAEALARTLRIQLPP